jgi:hypothetical protein
MAKKFFLLNAVDDFTSLYEDEVCMIESTTKKYKIKQIVHSNTFILNDGGSNVKIDGYLELEEIN